MGIGPFRGCFTNSEVRAPNPDPSRWALIKINKYQHITVALVKYKDCTNFEGEKILVFKSSIDLDESKDLDPHFSKDNTSPIARFIPTDEGWNMANDFAIELNLDIMFGEL